jgi:CheY-like chemotaxis protein
MENQTFRILLADDDNEDRLLFNDAFKEIKIKHVVQTVNNGMQLMDYLMEDDRVLPDIIFLDLNMPRKNGLECLKEIRNDKKFNEIMIAVYSTSAAEKDINETLINGANIYIKKPENFTLLKELLCEAVKTCYLYKEGPLDAKSFFLCL